MYEATPWNYCHNCFWTYTPQSQKNFGSQACYAGMILLKILQNVYICARLLPVTWVNERGRLGLPLFDLSNGQMPDSYCLSRSRARTRSHTEEMVQPHNNPLLNLAITHSLLFSISIIKNVVKHLEILVSAALVFAVRSLPTISLRY